MSVHVRSGHVRDLTPAMAAWDRSAVTLLLHLSRVTSGTNRQPVRFGPVRALAPDVASFDMCARGEA